MCCVVLELAVDGVGDPAFEAAQCFEVGLPRGPLSPVVGPPVGVEADLAERGHAQHVVDLAVASPGEPVSDLLT